MTLQPATRLGGYEIASLLGRGGMGEVYRARDTRLGREVAIKVLPAEVAQDPERLQRFEREARVLASLNHVNIATLHGFFRDRPEPGSATSGEEKDAAADIHFLVMELVEGDTLADRIARGTVAVDQAVRLFIRIAEGLDAAHERGVVHRDLKPANIKIGEESSGVGSDSWRVKILDFGLAKAMAPPGETGSGEAPMSESPTLTLAATQRGEVLGTAAYMSPEQAKGRPIDRRTDVWAFGACLFETLSGKRAFLGGDASELMASVLMLPPRWELLPAATPRRLRSLLERCLEKDPRRRLRDIGDALHELERIRDDTADDAPLEASSTAVPRRPATVWLAAAAFAGALAAGLAAWVLLRPVPTPSLPVVRTVLTGSGDPPLQVEPFVGLLALSPDGTTVAYTTDHGIYLRSLGELGARKLTDSGRSPFFSPDGQWVGYIESGSVAGDLKTGRPSRLGHSPR